MIEPENTLPVRPEQVVLARLDNVKMRWGGERGMARCPAHEDSTPSLSIRITREGNVLLHCFAGCDIADICGAAGLTVAELYADERGYYRPPGHGPRLRTPLPYTRPSRL